MDQHAPLSSLALCASVRTTLVIVEAETAQPDFVPRPDVLQVVARIASRHGYNLHLRSRLVRAVRVVAAGDALLAPTVTRRLLDRVVPTLFPKPGDPSAALSQLTERERAVLLLLARGRSNAEIGQQLHIGETTVKTHVSHLLEKLELRDRVQAVVFAYEKGLVAPGSD